MKLSVEKVKVASWEGYVCQLSVAGSCQLNSWSMLKLSVDKNLKEHTHQLKKAASEAKRNMSGGQLKKSMISTCIKLEWNSWPMTQNITKQAVTHPLGRGSMLEQIEGQTWSCSSGNLRKPHQPLLTEWHPLLATYNNNNTQPNFRPNSPLVWGVAAKY